MLYNTFGKSIYVTRFRSWIFEENTNFIFQKYCFDFESWYYLVYSGFLYFKNLFSRVKYFDTIKLPTRIHINIKTADKVFQEGEVKLPTNF